MSSLEEHCDAVKTELLSDKVTRRKASSGVPWIASHIAYRQNTAWRASERSFAGDMREISLDCTHYSLELECAFKQIGPISDTHGDAHLLAPPCARKASSA